MSVRSEPAALPSTMRAAVMYDVDDIRIEERPLPALAPGDVLVRTGASGVCSGDLMPWYVRRKAPFVFGHEPAGPIVATGAGERATARDGRSFALGDRVFAHHHAPDLTCDACLAGRYVHCETWRHTKLDPGGMAEYFRVPRANLADTLALPAHLSFADGSLVEPLACVVKSLRRALPITIERRLVRASRDVEATASRAPDIGPQTALVAASSGLTGTSLYVIGAGVMGLMHVAVAARLGATVFASDYLGVRREAALRLGAVGAFTPDEALVAVRAATGGLGARAVICGPGSPEALAHAVEATASDGTLLMFTPIAPDERMPFDQSAAYFRDIHLVASYSCGPDDTAEALRLIAAGVVTADRLGATEIPFPKVAAAYASMQRAEAIKTIVTFP
ncbi:MAG: zinc-dependent dehydrogenase [Vulcanimicrobiaceae bacterium]